MLRSRQATTGDRLASVLVMTNDSTGILLAAEPYYQAPPPPFTPPHRLVLACPNITLKPEPYSPLPRTQYHICIYSVAACKLRYAVQHSDCQPCSHWPLRLNSNIGSIVWDSTLYSIYDIIASTTVTIARPPSFSHFRACDRSTPSATQIQHGLLIIPSASDVAPAFVPVHQRTPALG